MGKFKFLLDGSLVLAAGIIASIPISHAAVVSGPPTNWDAHNALVKRFTDASESSYYALSGSAISGNANFPSNVTIERCNYNNEKALPTQANFQSLVSGYDCVLTVYPNGEPSYQMLGFFMHDGFQWLLHGPTRAGLIIPLDRYENGTLSSTVTPRDGSILYDGLAGRGGYINPYDEILGRGNRSGTDSFFGSTNSRRGE